MEYYNQLLEKLNQKLISVKELAISRRHVSHWQQEGLLSDERQEGQRWRRYSLVDVFWIGIGKTLRDFDVSNSTLRKIKPFLFKKSSISLNQAQQKIKLSVIEEALLEVLINQAPTFLIVYKDGSTFLLNNSEYVKLMSNEQTNDHHIVLNLNKLISELFSSLIHSTMYSDFAFLDKKEIELLQMVRNEKYSTIQVKKKNGELDLLEGLERIDKEKRIVDILKEGNFQDIELKQENGKVVCIHRKVKKKF